MESGIWQGCDCAFCDRQYIGGEMDQLTDHDAQSVLRIMSLLEAAYHLQTSAEHVAGVDNVWADLGSR